MPTGMNPYSLTAIRTLVAASVLWAFYLSSKKNRKFIYIYPAGILISATAGALNGVSSLLYYNGLTMIDAGVGQMLYSLYPLFVVIDSPPGRSACIQLDQGAAGPGASGGHIVDHASRRPSRLDWAQRLMLGAGLMYAMHLAVSQRVLYEMPAPTVALYVLTAMTVVVCAAYVLHGPADIPLAGLPPTMILAGITVLSRLLMFLGVKHLGSIQTALLGVTEILVTVVLSIFVLGEQLVGRQWIGAALLITSLLLIIFEPGIGVSLPRRKKKHPELANQKSSI